MTSQFQILKDNLIDPAWVMCPLLIPSRMTRGQGHSGQIRPQTLAHVNGEGPGPKERGGLWILVSTPQPLRVLVKITHNSMGSGWAGAWDVDGACATWPCLWLVLDYEGTLLFNCFPVSSCLLSIFFLTSSRCLDRGTHLAELT